MCFVIISGFTYGEIIIEDIDHIQLFFCFFAIENYLVGLAYLFGHFLVLSIFVYPIL